MIRSRLGRILSLAVASLSFGTHVVANVQPVVANERSEVAESCFAGVDYAHISVSDLAYLVDRYVTTMRDRGANDRQIVETLGYQIGKEARNCSTTQLDGLMQNLGLILTDQGIDYSSPKVMTRTLAHNFIKPPGAVEQDEVATFLLSVY